MPGQRISVSIKSITQETRNIQSIELRSVDGGELPAFTAGAHIDLHLTEGLVRSYSIWSSQSDRRRYRIAVLNSPVSRGGSRFVHESLRPGHVLSISLPRNNFPLYEESGHSIFVAGGIGITPLVSMIQRLRDIGRRWTLHFAARTRADAALLELIQDVSSNDDSVKLYFDQEPGGMALDLAALVKSAPPGSHLYCCGPAGMIQAFENAMSDLPTQYCHVEYFSATDAPAAAGGVELCLAKSGKTVVVPSGKTILQAILDAGVDAPYSCLEGACGSCETRVLEGLPDHRDVVLSSKEQASNQVMMICCSGSLSRRLVLDL